MQNYKFRSNYARNWCVLLAIFVNSVTFCKFRNLRYPPDPLRGRHTFVLSESRRERAIAAEARLIAQSQGRNIAVSGNGLLVEAHEMLDAQSVDIGIIRDALLGKITAKIGAVGTQCVSELLQRQVVLQIDSRRLTALLQQTVDNSQRRLLV